MKDFELRWRNLARAARAGDDPVPDPHPEWGPRLMRRARLAADAPAAGDLWRWYGLRGLAVSMAVLALCLLWAGRGVGDRPFLRPSIENVVAETFWLL